MLVHCWNPKKTAKLWQKICIPETLKELVQLPFHSSKEKTSGFSVPFVFHQLQDGKPHPCHLGLSYLLNVNHFWHGGGGERNQNTQLFYFECQKVLQPRSHLREASHFSDFLCVLQKLTFLGMGSTARCCTYTSTGLSSEGNYHCSHDVGISLWPFKLWCWLLSPTGRSIIRRVCFQQKPNLFISRELKLAHGPLAVLFATPRS